MKATNGGGFAQEVTHKELLTFSNLTNLEWQFVGLYDKETGRQRNDIFLKDILSAPKRFAETDEDGEVDEYTYGKTENGGYDEKKGKTEMRYNAGIAMEYFEKNQEELSEASFIEDWEVTYGAEGKQFAVDS